MTKYPDSDRQPARAGKAGLSRRRFLGASAAVAAGMVVPGEIQGGGAWAAEGPAAAARRGFGAAFGAPAREVQAKFRWWWPHGMVDTAEIRREIDQIADTGFGGVEIADVHHSVEQPLDPAATGWGTPAWVSALEAALDQAKRRGLVVDVTIGPSWPAALPSITPDDDGAVKELAHGVTTVAPGHTYSGPVPPPVVSASEGVTRQHLYAVQAARIADGSSPDDERPELVATSITDLTDQVDDGDITWTAPSDGRWVLVSYWLRGSGQRPERGPHTEPLSYVVDHFGAAGTDAVIAFWEQHILTPQIRYLLADTGGAMFEDSLEMETDATLWTPRMAKEFESRAGYSLMPYLPVLVEQDEDPVFSFDTDVAGQVRTDFNEVLSQLYIDHHLLPLKEWLNGLGLQLRIQPYGLQTDAVAWSALVDIPEGESLGFNNLDDFRSLAGGREMGGKKVLSSEAGAVFGGSYSVTWDQVLRTVSREYTAGVNQAVLHGFSYATAPGAQWPGFAAFTPYDGGVGYSESWGPRQPTWQHAPVVAGYLARNQLILQQGVPRCDVAFLRQKGYAGTGFGAAWFTPIGVTLGWTHEFLSPRLLELPTAYMEDGRLAPDGPAYKLLVFEGDAFSGRANTMPIDTAERLLHLASSGLHILVVGPWTDPRVPGIPQSGENERLAKVFEELLAQPTVHRVDDRAGIAAGVRALGLEPDVKYAESSPLLHARRHAPDADFYFFTNGSDSEAVNHDVRIPRAADKRVPYILDAWTGEIRRIGRYTEDQTGVSVRISLRPGEATVVAIARPRWAGTALGRGLHVTASEATDVRYDGRRLVVRDSRVGRYATTLSNGRVVTVRIDDVPAARTLSSWHLRVADWRPGGSPTETRHVYHERVLTELRPWTQIPDLEDVAGVGRYTATVQLPEDQWTGGRGAYLEFGQVSDTVRVWINGRELPPVDQVNPVVDVAGYLQPGANRVEVEVAGNLINRLRVTQPDVYGNVQRQDWGLVGPVRLVPYGQVAIGN